MCDMCEKITIPLHGGIGNSQGMGVRGKRKLQDWYGRKLEISEGLGYEYFWEPHNVQNVHCNTCLEKLENE